jgi:predicted ATPase
LFPTRAQYPEKGKAMKRFIITGAPGAGKTAILRQLELDGFSVVEEAATDVIAALQIQGTEQPWMHPSFIDAIARLQRDRQIRASNQPEDVQFHDRCVVCTTALAVYLGYPTSPFLSGELKRVRDEAIYETKSSSFAIWASSLPPRRGESAMRTHCVSRRFTKTLTGSSVSNWFPSSREAWRNGSA